MAKLNVLLLAAAEQSAREIELQAQLVSLFDAEPQIEALAVRLPRAEAMLAPRLIGLWDRLIFVGTAASPSLPLDAAVLRNEAEFLDAMPPVVIVGPTSGLWSRWAPFHAVLERTAGGAGGSSSIDSMLPDAAHRVLLAMQLQHS